MKKVKRIFSIFLVMCLVIGSMSMGTIKSVSAQENTDTTAEATETEFMRIFHLDVGRKYFTISQVKELIDTAVENNYTHVELAVGNDGLRFLLDDMSVTVGETTYTSENVTAGIKAGNDAYDSRHSYTPSDPEEWTQLEMDGLIDYATSKGIGIIPLINTPGHMDAIADAIEYVGITNVAFNGSVTTINIENTQAIEFTQNLLQKYVTYFASKGCKYFNMGADEYANDVNSSSFSQLSDAQYILYVNYINEVAAMIKNANMTPMAFNDGIYFNNRLYNDTTTQFDTNILVCYWEEGYSGYPVASADNLAAKGFRLINTNKNWYYVLGEHGTGWAGYEKAINNMNSSSVTSVLGASTATASGAMFAVWADNPEVEYSDAEETNIKTLISLLAENNEEQFGKIINVMQYSTVTDTITGVDYTASVDESELDKSIATVTAEFIEGTTAEQTVSTTASTSLEAGASYIICLDDSTTALTSTEVVSGNWGGTTHLSLVNNNLSVSDVNVWTLVEVNGGYKLQSNDGKYISLDTNSGTLDDTGDTLEITWNDSASAWYIGNTNGMNLNWLGGLNYAGGWTGGGTNWQFYKVNSTKVDSTKVQFTGVNPGTTHVTVGDVEYTINVSPFDINTVEPLTINRYLSTYEVYDGTAGNNHSITIAAKSANTENGLALNDIVPSIGDWEWEGTDVETVLWKGVVLDVDQSSTTSVDYSMSGTDFNYIRFWNGNWQCSNDRLSWVTISADQYVNAYYLQETDVTTEVTTFLKDWAFTSQNADNTTETYRSQKALSFAVVYPNGQILPATEDEIYTDSTLIYWDNLADLGFIRVEVSELYEVEKLTYTFGERVINDSYTTNWSSDETITWEKVTTNESTWYDETVCWDETYGTEPVINGADFANEINTTTWGADDAVLILIYLKPVITEDSLTVVYWDDSTNSEITNLIVNVLDNTVADEKTDTFFDIQNNTASIPTDGTSFVLDDNAYIVNAAERNIYFEKDLTQLSDIKGKYSSGLYEYVTADVSTDGKTLTLHYNLNSTKLQPYYIADFGLDIEIPFDDLGNGVSSVTASTTSSANGTVTVDPTNRKIIFNPTKTFTGVTIISITATFDNADTATYNVGIYPATTVYYEEAFATLTGFAIKENDDAPYNTTQQSLAYGNGSNHDSIYNFGYDGVYGDDAVGASNGTYAESTTYGDKAVFTFTGTGVDIYTNNTISTGNLFITVRNSAGSVVKMISVKTKMQNGTEDTTKYDISNAYNVPVASIKLDSRDTYTATISHTKPSGDATGDTVSLDGFRVYETIDYNSVVYQMDNEQNPLFVEMRDNVLSALDILDTEGNLDVDSIYAEDIAASALAQVFAKSETTTGAVLISKNSNYNAQDLLDNGPKNELYLRSNESLVFTLNVTAAQLGLKALNGTVDFTITYADGTVEEHSGFTSSTDMFYLIDTTKGTVTITNTSDSVAILSITELKAFSSSAEPAMFMALSEEDLYPALMCLGYEMEPVYADSTTNVNLVDYVGNIVGTTTLTSTGILGETGTLASADVLAAVNEVLPKGYALVDEISDVEVVYGETNEVNVQIGKVATLNITYYKLFKGNVGTATLTAVQTSDDTYATFGASEVNAACPEGYKALKLLGTRVKYGSETSRTVVVY